MPILEHNEMFDLAFRFVTETNENIFLTGKAGTGKTTFLKYLKGNSTKNIIVAAPTGVAAINAGGVTLHSLFQLPFHPFLPTKNHKEELLAKVRFNKQRQLLLQKMDLLVIDEISMVRCDIMDAVDVILRSVRRKYHLPFGGVQLLFIGDLYQLSPVAQSQEWNILREYYSSPFFFDSQAVKELSPLLLELNKIYRQKEGVFVELLNKVRKNQMDVDDFNILHSRHIPSFRPPADERYITLTSHNKQADLINQQQLYKIPEPFFIYNAAVEDDFPESMYPVEYELVLKKGAQVMFLKNDVVQKKYFNGKIGVVKSLEKDKIIVSCDNIDIEVKRETWENNRYTLNRADGKLEQEVLGTFTQYPLRLAWAITIHKSQGLTFEKVMIDAAAAFSSGQVYVALSRCTSLEGIVLLSRIPSSAISNNENVDIAQRSLIHQGSLPEHFILARRAFTQKLLEDLFSFNEAEAMAEQLDVLIKQHKSRLKDKAVWWIEDLKRRFIADKAVGVKFISRVASLINAADIIENNTPLQKRISDAANYFVLRFENYLSEIKAHPISTEHKEIAGIINEPLNDLAHLIFANNFYLQYCRSPFSVSGYLQHRLKYILPRFNLSCYANEVGEDHEGLVNTELLATLKRWRNMVCSETGQPIYMVANHTSLEEICTYLPMSKKDLMLMVGFGKAKAEKYGEEILEMVGSFCERHNLDSNMGAKPINSKKEKTVKPKEIKIDSKFVSLSLYKEGKAVSVIAKERGMSNSTIEGHLSHFINCGEIDINEVVNREKQDLINNAVTKYGTVSLKTLIENLPLGISYGEIKMVIASGGVVKK